MEYKDNVHTHDIKVALCKESGIGLAMCESTDQKGRESEKPTGSTDQGEKLQIRQRGAAIFTEVQFQDESLI